MDGEIVSEFDKYHVRYHKKHRYLCLSKPTEDDWGRPYMLDSEDRTEEVITALMQMMSKRVEYQHNPDKPYFGYKAKGVGTLLFIDDGYTFSIRPAARTSRR